MEGEKLCPLVRRPCDENCAWYCNDYDKCSIWVMAYALDALKDIQMGERKNYI